MKKPHKPVLAIESLEQRLVMHSEITFSGVGAQNQSGGRSGTFALGYFEQGQLIDLQTSIPQSPTASRIDVTIPNATPLDPLDGLNDRGLYSVVTSGNMFLNYQVYRTWTPVDEAYGSIRLQDRVPAPNLRALRPVRNIADGSITYSYAIDGRNDSKVAYRGYVEIELYYATGPNPTDIKEKINGQRLESSPGRWSFTVPRAAVQDAFPDSPNARRSHVVAIIDKNNLAAEYDESVGDNSKAVSLPNLVALTPKKAKDGDLRVGYRVEDKAINNPDTGLWLYWSDRPTIRPNMTLIKRIPIDVTKTGERWVDNAISARTLNNAPKGKPYLIARIDPTGRFMESNKTDNVAAFNPPTLDFIATSLAVAKNGSVSYAYAIKNADKNTKSTLAEIYWVGPSGKYIGSPIYSAATQSKSGTYGPIAAAQLGERPNGAEGLALVVDRRGIVEEKSDTNNRTDAVAEDPDDQIAEASPQGIVSGEANRTKTLGGILSYKDVDMYSFSVLAGQKLSFDFDSQWVDGAIQIFDATGKPLAEGGGVWIKNGLGQRTAMGVSDSGSVLTLRESVPSSQSYLEVSFPQSGIYYVGVSSKGNLGYNPITGELDTDSSSFSSSNKTYSLVVTSVSELPAIAASTSAISGIIVMPNPGGHKASVDLSLTSTDGSVIQSGRNTWVTIHGRDSEPAKLATVANNLRVTTGDQVLQLDWRSGASDNWPAFSTDTGLQGAEWIPYVADWLSGTLRAIGLTGVKVNLVGHSWGSYVAQRIGATERLGTVNSIVALDPARSGAGVPETGPEAINFSAVSLMSWAFYGNGSFGSAPIAGTATEAFVVSLSGKNSIYDSLYLHDVPILLFQHIAFDRNIFAGLFDVSRLVTRKSLSLWAADRVSSDWTFSGAAGEGVFEAVVFVQSDSHIVGISAGTFVPRLLSYVANGTKDTRVNVNP